MKHTKKLVLALLIFTLSMFLLTGCQKVDIPEGIQIEGRTLTWSAVRNAVGYKIKVNDDEFETAENHFTIPDAYYGRIEVSVQAYNEKKASDYSQTATFIITLKLNAPVNIVQNGNTITWDKVDNATGYIIKIDGIEFFTPTNEYTVEINEPAEIQVLAIGSEDEIILPSEYSQVFFAKIVLAAPDNLTESNGIISWSNVVGADSYIVLVNDIEELATSNTSISLKYKYVGAVNIKVKAISGSDSYLDSAYSFLEVTLPKLTLSAPQNLSIDNGVLVFDEVEGASSYEIYANEVLIETIDMASYIIPSSILEGNTYLQVKAISSIHFASELSQKVACKVVEIASEQQLRELSFGSYILTQDITLLQEWQPIQEFGGILDGNGYCIKAINITSDMPNVGFFAKLSNAIVKNITLIGAINSDISYNNSNIGGLAGKIEYSNITNCIINIDIDANVYNGIGKAGGVAGNIQNSNVASVYYSGTINTLNCITGGFVAKADNPQVSTEIAQCSSVANISVSGGEQAYSGGFIGIMLDNMLSISQCKADIELIGTNYVGGFVGYLGTGEIKDSYSIGTTISTADTLIHMGGFVGRLEGYNTQVSSCIAMCTVGEPQGDNVFVGGFAGNTVGGSYASVYKDCLYDKTLAPIDRIGNAGSGIGDGITSKTTNELKSLAYSSAYSNAVWELGGNALPKLKWED